MLVQIFGLTVTNFRIHSLALDASDQADLPSKTATVSFRAVPALLGGFQGHANEWGFDLPPTEVAECGPCRIYFDTHFHGFTPLSPADHNARVIDCVVIPGWGGHALGSFRSHTSPYVWLRDSLPRHCPELRVWTYGYPSPLDDASSSADPYEFAERFKTRLRILRQQTKTADEVKPLIFIAHSLGGWIFKDAIIQMRKSPNEVDQEIVLSTYGALFFGVPTHGMNVEAIASMVQDLPARYISTLLDQQDGFRLRQRQHEDFCQAFDYKDSRIIQFFELERSPTVIQDAETKKWSRKGPLALLVSPASATHGRAWETGSEYTYSLAGNHSDMIKFSNDRDEYPTVRSCLQQFTKRAALVVKNRWKKSSNALESSDPDHLSSEQQNCFQSLCFPEMNERKNGIEVPASGTCEWLSKHPTYLKWFDQQHGMLWIKGKPGAGKSTLIKHAVGGLAQFRGGDTVLASFFFHGRGALIQKTTAGLFRSLLHQLLLQLPELLKEFSGLHRTRIETEGQYGARWEWHEKELQNFFKTRVIEAARTRTIRLYIDALDEAGEDTATELVEYLQQLSSSLAVCFSCRHYPLLSLEDGLEICVEDGNGPDIDTYIRTSINTRILPEEIAHPIHEDIAAKSSGSFQWVALVIRLILRLYRNGKSLAVLRSKIKQLPSELDGLYSELLGSLDEEDLSESLILMQWVLFSLRPLRLSELRFALVMGQEVTCPSNRECQSSSWFSSSDEDLKRKVLALSRGLVEVREYQGLRTDCNDSITATYGDSEDSEDSEDYESENVMQFIHQSVKDFLLEGGLQLLDKGPIHKAIGRGNSCLSRSCIRSLSMEDVSNSLDTLLPFLSYAARYWHLHLEEAEKQDPPQADLLSILCMSWNRFTQTWIKVSQELGLSGEDFPPADWELLHVASRFNLPSLVNAVLERGVDANLRDREGRTPLSIAATAGSVEVAKMLLDRQDVDRNSRDDHGSTPLMCAVYSRRTPVLTLLLGRMDIDANAQDNGGRTPLSYAAGNGHKLILEVLLDRKDINANLQDNNGRTPLFYAAIWGKEAISKLLLDRNDIDPNTQDKTGLTPLACAARWSWKAVVRLLLDRNDIDANVQDHSGRTPLSYAAARRDKHVVQLLLDRNDVDPNIPDNTGITPLDHATRNGHVEIATILRDRMRGAGSLGS